MVSVYMDTKEYRLVELLAPNRYTPFKKER